MLESMIHALIRAMKSGDKEKEQSVLSTLRRVGMDEHTAKTLARELWEEA